MGKDTDGVASVGFDHDALERLEADVLAQEMHPAHRSVQYMGNLPALCFPRCSWHLEEDTKKPRPLTILAACPFPLPDHDERLSRPILGPARINGFFPLQLTSDTDRRVLTLLSSLPSIMPGWLLSGNLSTEPWTRPLTVYGLDSNFDQRSCQRYMMRDRSSFDMKP
jgi:hypothetical protein